VTAGLTVEDIRRLASFDGGGAPVVSCYLDVDGRRSRAHDVARRLESLMRTAAPDGDGAADDLRRITEHVRGIDRHGTRGLAVFACSAAGLWEVIDLPVAVRDELVVDRHPHVRQLEAVLSEHERFAVLLADRQRARLLVFELGALVERNELFDQLPRHDDDGGDRDRDHLRSHADVAVRRHLKGAADAAFAAWREAPFDHLVVGAPEELVADVERELHSYLQPLVAARVTVPVAASDDVIVDAIRRVESRIERDKDATAVAQLRSALGGRGAAVAGLDGTVRALVEHRVDTLLVSDGYVAPGWRCSPCRWIGVLGRPCPLCGEPMDALTDLVGEAVDEALRLGAAVRVCRDNADIDVLGRIGALLRF
jgi:peptide chain release factor subunit 1